ncbi:hypothetical protein P152DRAFT_53263 [Eremomyces bilateralis CBS 781.70]|uniref:Mis12-domain-containing protein n=1 Tax=Eremomyces bilateralis CBS 781.70 TaxID=1392243 RepID=A0A6G1G158_9PEZI|nr:uncharacterized protein P152DRAFT_53263 [Eremomyces bilateralis CBS 781.70]KAF1811847.1 hypothetical protein P152DRAFT_53263 [Eremomyces bilateralis CBS 781.70]
MSGTKQMEVAMLTEHLRYTPITLLDDIINTVNELVNRAIDAAEEGLLAALPTDLGFSDSPEIVAKGSDSPIQSQAEIEDGSHKLETLVQANVDKNFDKLELFVLQNILTVPKDLVPWIQLPHYEDIEIVEDSSRSAESTLALMRKLRETKKLHSLLSTELTRNAALTSNLQAFLSSSDDSHFQLGNLTNSQAASALGVSLTPNPLAPQGTESRNHIKSGPLSTHSSFAVAQLPHLRTLLAGLKPNLSAINELPKSQIEQSADVQPGDAQVRRNYIEGRGRRILESVGVPDLIGGSGQALGPTIDPEEVEALEGWIGENAKEKRNT